MIEINGKNECFFLKNASDLFYFSGLQNPDAYIVCLGNTMHYFTDDRYLENAYNKLKDYTIHHISDFFAFLSKNKIDKLGIEDDLPYLFCERLKEHGVRSFYPISDRIQQKKSL